MVRVNQASLFGSKIFIDAQGLLDQRGLFIGKVHLPSVFPSISIFFIVIFFKRHRHRQQLEEKTYVSTDVGSVRLRRNLKWT